MEPVFGTPFARSASMPAASSRVPSPQTSRSCRQVSSSWSSTRRPPGCSGGQVQVMFAPTPPSIEHIRSVKLRALAVTTATRTDALPDIPTVGEFVPGYEASNWYGVGIPKNTPADIVDKLNKEINAGLADPKIQ